MRWKQSLNEETGKYEFIPIDEAARSHNRSAAVHGDITSFVSSVDRSVITDRKQLREHNLRNDVVSMDEYGTDHWDKQAKVREAHYTGQSSRQETLKRRQDIYETINRLERADS
jgi:hypothetical protein